MLLYLKMFVDFDTLSVLYCCNKIMNACDYVMLILYELSMCAYTICEKKDYDEWNIINQD